jgi:DNA-directed RNA polymerase specialized sigma24 family protein
MSSAGSVTGWLHQLTHGDPAAVQPLWERYFQRLVGLARQRLQAAPRRAADEEDVALSALNSFFQGVERGRFPQLSDRDGLWRLLALITARKAQHLVRDEGRRPAADAGGESLEQLFSQEPTPDVAAEFIEEYQRRLRCLGDRELAWIAAWRMEGQTLDEIAQRLGYVPRTVKRKLRLIRAIWGKEVAS